MPVICKLFPGVLLLFSLPVSAKQPELSHETLSAAYTASYQLEKKRDYKGAMHALNPVMKAYPSGYTVNYRSGWLAYCDSNYTDAFSFLRKAQLVCPSSLEILNCLTLVHAAKEEWTNVEKEALKALKIDYYNSIANYWYARSLMINGKYKLSEEVSRKMLAVFPTSVLFLSTLGETLYAAKKYDESKEIFLSCIILDPYNESAKKYLQLFEKRGKGHRQ